MDTVSDSTSTKGTDNAAYVQWKCFVAQGRSGGVQDTAADRHHPGKESSHQTGTRQPTCVCSTERNVSMKKFRS